MEHDDIAERRELEFNRVIPYDEMEPLDETEWELMSLWFDSAMEELRERIAEGAKFLGDPSHLEAAIKEAEHWNGPHPADMGYELGYTSHVGQVCGF